MVFAMDNPNEPKTIKASEFKAKCLKLMDEVAENGEEIVITKNGQPVAKLAPFRQKPEDWFGQDRDRIRILGDIVSPMPDHWFDAPGEQQDKLL